jgi:plastocyanin
MTKKLIGNSMTLSILLSLLTFSVNSFAVQSIDGQIHMPDTTPDATPIAVVLYISEDKDGNVFFNPSEFTIKQGEEVLVLNNSTGDHSFTNGESQDDKMAGKIFDTKMIKSGSFAEYLAFNLSPGEYPFYSSTDPLNIKGKMTVLPQK